MVPKIIITHNLKLFSFKIILSQNVVNLIQQNMQWTP